MTVQASSASSYDRQIRGLGAALALVIVFLGIYLSYYFYSGWLAQRSDKGRDSFATTAVGDTSSSSSGDGDVHDEIHEPIEGGFVSVNLENADISIVSGQWDTPKDDQWDAPEDEVTRQLNNEIMARTLSGSCRKSFSAMAQELVQNMDEELGNIDDDVYSSKSGSMVSGTSSLCIYDDTSSCQSRRDQARGRLTPLAINEDAWKEFLDSHEEETLPPSSSLAAVPVESIAPQDYELPNPTSIVL